MAEFPSPTSVSSQRRKLPFVVPPELLDQASTASQHLKSYDALVAKREAHVDVLERQLLDTRDSLVKLLGADHQLVAQVNERLARQNELWI